ncbi:MAG: hypothetical protein EHM40_03370 [Chloroflexi bacterium]|nr:MAG: hypothetical protein EHM40_03370 [Chloroflexota bacterium]
MSPRRRIQKTKKLDGRRMINQRAALKRSAAGRNGRGQDLVIHGKLTSKRDPFLQQRIDEVVRMALSAQQSAHTMDVLYEGKLRFSRSGLKVHRVG